MWFNILVEFCHHYVIQQTYLIKVQIISLNRRVGKECSVGTISVQEKLASNVLSDVCQVKSSESCSVYHLDWNSLYNRLRGFSWQPIIAIHFKLQSIFSILEVFQQQIMQSELVASCSEHQGSICCSCCFVTDFADVCSMFKSELCHNGILMALRLHSTSVVQNNVVTFVCFPGGDKVVVIWLVENL